MILNRKDHPGHHDMEGLTVTNIHKVFGETPALRGISFSVREGEIVALLGPSGCGKSTLLEIVGGLIPADGGSCAWNGKDLRGVPPHKRNFGLMFQDYALFPHKNVRENVAFGLRMLDWDREKINSRVAEILTLVGLPDFGARDVTTLSGGEQQRVALARSLAPGPRLLMLDEPLGALDRTLRDQLLGDLREILLRSRQTALYVTHDQVEAFTVADRIVLMRDGQAEQIGTPRDIYLHPDSLFTARFLGLVNILPGEITLSRGKAQVSTELGTWTLHDHQPGHVSVLLRPDRVRLDSEGPGLVQGKLEKCSFQGNMVQIHIQSGGFSLRFEFPAASFRPPEEGESVSISFDPELALQVFRE